MFNKIIIRIWQLKHNEVALNSAWQFFERFVGLGCSFIASIFVIRYFAPAEYGIFAYAASYVTLFSSLTSMGLQSIVVREVVKDSIPTETILGSAFVIMICGAVAALILAVSGALLTHEKSTATWIILIMCLTNIIGSLAVINYYFQAKIKARYIAYIMLVQDVIDICIRIGMIHFKAKLLSFALLGLIESILAYAAIYLLFRSSSKLKSWKVDIKTIKFLLHQSIPLAISGIMINLYMRLDQVMIEYYCGMQAVAEYSIGVKMVEIFYMIPMIITPNVLPIAVKHFQQSEEKFDTFMIKLLRFYIVTSLIIIVAIWFSAESLIIHLYGVKYIASIKILQYTSIVILLSCIGVTGSLWMNVKEIQKYSIHRTLTGLVVCVLANYILIPWLGIIGAVYATLLAQFSATYLSSIISPKLHKYNSLVNKAFLNIGI